MSDPGGVAADRRIARPFASGTLMITFRCQCGKQSNLPESFLGKRVRCNFCGVPAIVSDMTESAHDDLDWETHVAESLMVAPALATAEAGTDPAESPAAGPSPAAPRLFDEAPSGEVAAILPDDEDAEGEAELDEAEAPSVANPKEYKVLTPRDRHFRGKFDPARLEAVINDYARKGWVVRSMTAGNIGGFGGNREELVLLLERG